jgi:cytochrome c oxidase subunit 3
MTFLIESEIDRRISWRSHSWPRVLTCPHPQNPQPRAAAYVSVSAKANAMTTQSIHLAGESESANPARVYITGTYLALAGILMFFTGLVSAWVVRKGLSTSSLEAPLELPRALLGLNTFVLIASSATLEIARRGLRSDHPETFRRWWYATSVMGIAFLIGQISVLHAMALASELVAAHSDASFFFLFTVAHGILLVSGIVVLLIVVIRDLGQTALATAAQVARLYWHFLTALWCAIFILLMVSGK